MAHDGFFGPRFDEIVKGLQTEEQDETTAGAELAPAVAAPVSPHIPPVLTPMPFTAPPEIRPGGPETLRHRGTLSQRAAYWLTSRTGIQTMATTLGTPSAVLLIGEISAAQSAGWTGFGSTLLFLGGGALAVASLAKKFGNTITLGAFGTAALGAQLGMAALDSPWMALVGWTIGGVTAGSLRVGYANGRKKPEAELRILAAEAQVREASVVTEQYKALAQQSKARMEELKFHVALQAATAPAAVDAGPNLSGATREERELRHAFWVAFKVELPACPVTPTLTGWIADISLPADLARNAARQGWDKVATALGLPGRFALEDGASTNVLRAKFVDETRPRPDATWRPDRISPDARKASLGIDTETGEPVFIDADERLLICGASGTGKSWASRPLMAHWHTYGWLVLVDGKGEEGNVWESVCTVAREPEEILAVIDSAHVLMGERKAEMRERGISVWDGPQLTIVIDEGQVVLALPGLKKDDERMQRLVELSSLGRSRGVVLAWATQKPVMSGSAPGVNNLIAPNLLQRLSLRVADTQEAQTALDDCAHYNPQKIPAGTEWKGHGYLKGYGPALIRMWTMNDADVQALPAKHWSPAAVAAPAATAPAADPEAGLTDNQRAVLAAVRAGHDGPSDIERETGINKGSVKRALDRLEELRLI